MGYNLRGVGEPESVSEHCFHLLFLVWVLAPRAPQLDTLRALDLAMVHDLPEVRTGDLPRTAAKYLPPGAKRTAELAIARDLLAPLGDRAVELMREYQAKTTPEARFVSCCDKLQMLLKVTTYEQWGAGGLGEFAAALKGFDDGGFEPIAALIQELRDHRQDQGLGTGASR